MKQAVSSPSRSGNATRFGVGGKTQFSDGLWNNHLIGDLSSQGKAVAITQLPAVHNFVYNAYFYSDNISASQALEFDINQFVDGKSYIWGHECGLREAISGISGTTPGRSGIPQVSLAIPTIVPGTISPSRYNALQMGICCSSRLP
jgi:hypothetical protein